MAHVANTVSRIMVTPTTNNGNASIDHLDCDGNALMDVDMVTAGHQVDLEVGENTIKVQVTAEDTTTTETYTVVVTRAPPADCEAGAVWYTTLTVGENEEVAAGYCGPRAGTFYCNYGSLDDDGFTLDGTGYTVESLRWSFAHVHLTMDRDFPAAPLGKLTLGIGTHRFALADADRGNRNNNIDNNYRWTIPVALHNVNAGVKIIVQLFEAIRPATGKTRPRRARRSWISSSGPTR